MVSLPGRVARGAGRISALVAVAILTALPAQACVGVACLLTWSTEPDGGALTVEYDFANEKVQTFRAFCASGTCLYSAADPGFMNTGETPPEGFFSLADGVTIRLELVDVDPAVIFKINAAQLEAPGSSASLGTTPELHTHPTWQLSLPEGETGDFSLSFKLTTDSPQYDDSQVFTIVITNEPPSMTETPSATVTPTATPTIGPPACVGDCNGDGDVDVSELILGVASALDGQIRCAACDRDLDGVIEISELVSAVNSALIGCPALPTPTATVEVMLETIQETIFSPRCATTNCHTSAAMAGGLALDPANAHTELVNVDPTTDTARLGMLKRVAPGDPAKSFLLIKLEGPPPDQGSRMPQGGPFLTAAEVQLIRDWIVRGAQP